MHVICHEGKLVWIKISTCVWSVRKIDLRLDPKSWVGLVGQKWGKCQNRWWMWKHEDFIGNCFCPSVNTGYEYYEYCAKLCHIAVSATLVCLSQKTNKPEIFVGYHFRGNVHIWQILHTFCDVKINTLKPENFVWHNFCTNVVFIAFMKKRRYKWISLSVGPYVTKLNIGYNFDLLNISSSNSIAMTTWTWWCQIP